MAVEHGAVVPLPGSLAAELAAGRAQHLPVLLEDAEVGRVAGLVVAVAIGRLHRVALIEHAAACMDDLLLAATQPGNRIRAARGAGRTGHGGAAGRAAGLAGGRGRLGGACGRACCGGGAARIRVSAATAHYAGGLQLPAPAIAIWVAGAAFAAIRIAVGGIFCAGGQGAKASGQRDHADGKNAEWMFHGFTPCRPE